MQDKLRGLIDKASRIAEAIRSSPGRIRIISHYDADGITSASIMIKALTREGRDFHLSVIKQLSEETVEELSREGEKLFLFLDLGSGQLDAIQKHLLSNGARVIVADHHHVQGEAHSKDLFHINPMTFGISENISGSGVSYLLARAMSPENKDLSDLAIIGAIGDSQMGSIGPDWGLSGINKEILLDAVNSGKIKLHKGLRLWGRYTRSLHKALEYSMDPYIPGVSGSESGAVQFLNDLKIELKTKDGEWRTLSDLSQDEQKKLASGIIAERVMDSHENPEWIFGDIYELTGRSHRDANEFATILNATGKMKKEHIGIALCLNVPGSSDDVKSVLSRYRRNIGKALGWVRNHKEIINTTEHAHYLMAGTNVSEHIISNVVSILHRSGMLEGDKPVFAFVDTEDSKVKISARASEELVKSGLNLKDVMADAAEKMGGEGGGHAGASGATIPGGNEKEFISLIEGALKPKESEINIKETKKDIKPVKKELTYGREIPKGEKVEGEGLVRYFGAQPVQQ